MKKVFILVVALLMIGNAWAYDVTLKAGKIQNLPYKSDFVGGVSFDFSLVPSVKSLKNLKGEVNLIAAMPESEYLPDGSGRVFTNQIFFDVGLFYQLSYEVHKIKFQPFVGVGASYLYAAIQLEDYYYEYYYGDTMSYTLKDNSSFNLYLEMGLKAFLSKNIFIKPEVRFYTGRRTMTAFLIGVGYQIKPGKKSRP